MELGGPVLNRHLMVEVGCAGAVRREYVCPQEMLGNSVVMKVGSAATKI